MPEKHKVTPLDQLSQAIKDTQEAIGGFRADIPQVDPVGIGPEITAAELDRHEIGALEQSMMFDSLSNILLLERRLQRLRDIEASEKSGFDILKQIGKLSIRMNPYRAHWQHDVSHGHPIIITAFAGDTASGEVSASTGLEVAMALLDKTDIPQSMKDGTYHVVKTASEEIQALMHQGGILTEQGDLHLGLEGIAISEKQRGRKFANQRVITAVPGMIEKDGLSFPTSSTVRSMVVVPEGFAQLYEGLKARDMAGESYWVTPYLKQYLAKYTEQLYGGIDLPGNLGKLPVIIPGSEIADDSLSRFMESVSPAPATG